MSSMRAGGIVNAAAEYPGWSSDRALALVEATGERLVRVLDHADVAQVSTNLAADGLARSVIANAAIESQAVICSSGRSNAGRVAALCPSWLLSPPLRLEACPAPGEREFAQHIDKISV